MITVPDFESYLRAMGDAVVFIGDPFVDSGLDLLGAKEGDVSVAWNVSYNNLTFPENTGDAVHEAEVQGYNPVLTVPLIIGNPDLWAKLSPTGILGGGHSSAQPVAETSVLIVPHRDLIAAGAGGYSKAINPGAWVPSAPENWLWFWRAYLQFPDMAFRNAEQGKMVSPVTVQAMHDKTKPEGHKLFTIGDPSVVAPVAIDVII